MEPLTVNSMNFRADIHEILKKSINFTKQIKQNTLQKLYLLDHLQV